MKTKLFKVQYLALLLLCALCSTQAKAIDYTCWTQAIYKMAVKGTSTTSTECGQIYVSTVLVTDESQIEAVTEEITTDPLYHYGPAASCKQDYYYYVKANEGYNFIGWGTLQPSSASWKPSSASYAPNEANKVGDYYWYKSTTSSPYADNTEAKPTKLTRYAVFEKVEKMEEPTGTTPVEVTAVTGTTELVEGSISKNFSVDIVLSENLPYEMPGSDKNAKPNESLKQFVTVKGANGNTSEVASYSLAYESNGGSSYSCHTIRLFFPYNIKTDTYTVHIPYGLYTTVNSNPTPTYEFTITVTTDENPYLTIKSQFPAEGFTIKYTAASQTSEPDASKGEFEKSNITAAIEFNEVVESIDESKKDGISLTNSTVGVNYRPSNVIRNAAMFGKVSGAVSIAYPELVNGEYTLTIPAGLFVGSSKTNEEITIHFKITGFNSVQLKPYEMSTDQITPKANDMSQKIEMLQDITISYNGEFGPAKALVGDVSNIKVQKYTEEIVDGVDSRGNDTHEPVRTYYPVSTTPIVNVVDGKMVVSFFPAIEATGLYEVQIPAGMAANMEPGEMTMIEKVNAGYALTPAYPNLSFNVKAPVKELEVTMFVSSAAKYGTFIAPFDVEIPAGVTASTVHNCQDGTLILEPLTTSTLLADTPVILQSEETVQETFKGEVSRYFDPEVSYIDGLLVGVYQKIKAPVKSYVLQNQNNKVAFYIVKEEVGQPDILPYRCYLSEGAAYGAPALYFVEDDATSINGINPEFINAEGIYNANGVRMNTLQKGLNIIKTANGTKKVVIK